MNPFQAAATFPFVHTDPSKVWAYFRLPSVSIETLLEVHRKNAAALTNANQAVFDGLATLAQRQGELLQATVDQHKKVISDVLAASPFEQKASKQANAAQVIYDSTAARFHELFDIGTKANGAVVDILSARITEALAVC